MAIVYAETPDATQAKEFWTSQTGTVTYDTTAGSKKSGLASWKCDSGAGNTTAGLRRGGVLADAGRRVSWYSNFAAWPGAVANIAEFTQSGGSVVFAVRLGTNGKLVLTAGTGATGTTVLTAGVCYRISVSYTITDTTHFHIKIYIDGVLEIDNQNAGTLPRVTTDLVKFGWWDSPGANLTHNFQHVYIDDVADLTDPGDMRVTAKLPATVYGNSFDTTGGTGAINERPISEINYKQHANTTYVSQNYNVQAANAGDVNISEATYVAYIGWVWAKKGTGTGTGEDIALNGLNYSISLTTTPALYTKIIDSASYPTDPYGIGLRSTFGTADTFLYECGVLVVYIAGISVSIGPVAIPVALPALGMALAKGIGPVAVPVVLNSLVATVGYTVSIGPVAIPIALPSFTLAMDKGIGPVAIPVSLPTPTLALSKGIGPVAIPAVIPALVLGLNEAIGPVTIPVALNSLGVKMRLGQGPHRLRGVITDSSGVVQGQVIG